MLGLNISCGLMANISRVQKQSMCFVDAGILNNSWLITPLNAYSVNDIKRDVEELKTLVLKYNN